MYDFLRVLPISNLFERTFKISQMSNYVMSWFEKEEFKNYIRGLTYLGRTGFEFTIYLDGKALNTKDHKTAIQFSFGGPQKDLPMPVVFGGSTLLKPFMTHYKIITTVDIAKLMRVVSIILTNFNGPVKDDHFHNHRDRLQQFFFNQEPFDESVVMEALVAYDYVFGKQISISKSEYIAFARTLNYFFNLFKPDDPIDDYFFDDY